jgi:SSS family solute:Na+ symporter
VIDLPGQGMPFVAAAAAFIVDIVVSVAVSMVTKPKPREELVGFVYSETQVDIMSDPAEAGRPWFQRAVPLGMVMLVLTIGFNIVFH